APQRSGQSITEESRIADCRLRIADCKNDSISPLPSVRWKRCVSRARAKLGAPRKIESRKVSEPSGHFSFRVLILRMDSLVNPQSAISTGRGRLLPRLLFGGGGLFLLLQGGCFGGDLDRHLFELFAFGLILDQFLEFAVEQTFVKHRLSVFRLYLQRLFEVFKPLGHARLSFLPVGQSLRGVIHLAVMELIFAEKGLVLITRGLIVRAFPIIDAYPI